TFGGTDGEAGSRTRHRQKPTPWQLRKGFSTPMTESLMNRIERAEAAARGQSRFLPQCICFPEKEQPFFHWPVEQLIAARVKCPLHGDRFTPVHFFVYVAEWLREKRQVLLQAHHSEQYCKAWYAGFPQELWPAEEISNDDRIALRLKVG